MATFTDTFTGVDGSAPSSTDWIVENSTGSTATIQSNALQMTTGAVGGYADKTYATWLDGTPTNVTITLDVTPASTAESFFEITLRGSGNGSAAAQYCYRFEVAFNGFCLISRAVNWVGTNIASGTQITGFGAGVPIHVEASVYGSIVTFWAWTGSVRPATPMYSVVDTALADAGSVGFWVLNGNAAASTTWTVDNVAITVAVQGGRVAQFGRGLPSATPYGLGLPQFSLPAMSGGSGAAAGTDYTIQIDDPVGAVDSQSLDVGRQVDDVSGLTGTQGLDVGRGVTDPVSLADAQAFGVGLAVTDTTGLVDTQALLVGRAVTDSSAAADTQALTVGRGLTDPTGSVDAQMLAAARAVTDSTGLTDAAGTSSLYPALATLTDDFTTQDTTKWSGWGTDVLISSGRLQINPTPSYPNAFSAHTYDLRNSALSVEVPQVTNVGNGTVSTYLTVGDASGNTVTIQYANGLIHAMSVVGGVTSDVTLPYNPSAHRIWRIRESGGTLYWEASASGASWNQLRTPAATPLNAAAVTVVLQAGYYGTEPAPGSVLFDNVNATYPSAPGSPRTFYVDPAGSDSADGLGAGTAWQTLGKVSTTALYPGDQVLFKRGGTWTGNLAAADSGATGNPITYGAYGTGAQPVIDGGGSSGTAGSSEPAQLYGAFVVLDGLELRGAQSIDVNVLGADCTVQNCTVRWGAYGVVQNSGFGARVKVLSNTIVDVNVGIIGPGTNDDGGAMSILLGGDAAEIAYNAISGAFFTSPDYGIDGSAVEIYGATNAVVHHNRISDCAGAIEMGNSATANCTIHTNVVTIRAGLGGGIGVHGTYSSVGVTDPFGPVLGTKIYHNTVVVTDGDAMWLGLEGEVDLRNNIFVTSGAYHAANLEASSRTITEGNNVYWNLTAGAGGPNNFQGSGTPNASSTIADPLLVSTTDVRLLQGSPAVDRGANLGYTTDYAGNPRNTGAAPDSGAFEGVLIPVTVSDPAGSTDTRSLGVGRGFTDPAGLVDAQGSASSATVTDPAGLADAAAVTVGRGLTDPAGLVDTASPTHGFAAQLDDPAGLADSQAVTVSRQVDDPAGGTDATAVTAAWVRIVTDDAGLTDTTSTAKSGSGVFTLDDSAGLTDAAAVTGTWLRQVDDLAGVADSTALAVAGTLADTAGAADTQALTVGGAVTDPVGASDSAAAAVARQVDDPAGSTDSAALAVGRRADDTAGSADSAALAVGRLVDDPAGLVDVAASTGQWVRALTDDAGVTDAAAAAKSGSQTYTIDDPAGLTDTLTAAGGWLRQVDDPAGATDSAAAAVDRRVDDASTITDTVARVMSVTWAVSDTAGLADAAAQASTTFRAVTDSAGLTDDDVVFLLADVIPVRVTSSRSAVTATGSSTAVLVPVYSSTDDVL